jgi:hypothetical protein
MPIEFGTENQPQYISMSDAIIRMFNQLLAQGSRILMALAEIQAQLARVDAATSAIAQKITDLTAKIGTGMSDADVATVTAGLTAEADKLEAMGKPDVPV